MPDFVKPLSDLEVIEGKEAVLRCKVAGLPYPTIAWYHNGKRIDSTEERKMTQCKDTTTSVYPSFLTLLLPSVYSLSLSLSLKLSGFHHLPLSAASLTPSLFILQTGMSTVW